VKFCEYEALAVDGSDCPALGLIASKRFCIVTPEYAPCVETRYEVADRVCRVLDQHPLGEWRECSQGAPTFSP
jgi:hypothetical protein